jgi:hypothetical protein
MRTEPAPADASRACQRVFLVSPRNVFNRRRRPVDEVAAGGEAPPLPVKGASAQFSGVYASWGLTGDGRLLALGPDPAEGVPAPITTDGLFDKAPPALWLWDTQTGRRDVARTQLPCVDPQNRYDHPHDIFGVSVSGGAPGQPPGTWFWLSGPAVSGDIGWTSYRLFIPAT